MKLKERRWRRRWQGCLPFKKASTSGLGERRTETSKPISFQDFFIEPSLKSTDIPCLYCGWYGCMEYCGVLKTTGVWPKHVLCASQMPSSRERSHTHIQCYYLFPFCLGNNYVGNIEYRYASGVNLRGCWQNFGCQPYVVYTGLVWAKITGTNTCEVRSNTSCVRSELISHKSVVSRG